MSASGWWIVAVAFALSLACSLALPNASFAQRPRVPGGTGGGPKYVPPPPIRAPSVTPTIPPASPSIDPSPSTLPPPPADVQVPAAPVVRFRCDLAPDSYECTKPASEDGDGDEEKCSCARDRCRINRIGNRVCEKLR